ncbi:MAG: putative Ig domain-containing protein, partial [Rhodoferax sp.]|nr:putative Ig domain-containing protein [Rhodoferax sp.]
FAVGTAGTFTVTATGYPTPALARTGGTLPTGVTLIDNGDGTATLSGTPAAGTGGSYTLTFTASNTAGNTPQTFTLNINQAPVITSAAATTFNVGAAGSFTVTRTGFPAANIAMTGALPGGVTFNPATRVLAGTPNVGTVGTYPLVFTASNGVTPDYVQNFVLTVGLGGNVITFNQPTSPAGFSCSCSKCSGYCSAYRMYDCRECGDDDERHGAV